MTFKLEDVIKLHVTTFNSIGVKDWHWKWNIPGRWRQM
jgi:hypothetical protein